MKKKIIFSTGGTGGHIFPAINLMQHFSEQGYEVLIVTDIRGKEFIKKYAKFDSYVLNAGTFTNKSLIKKFLSLFVIVYSMIQSIFIIKKEKPNLIFGFGGYVSFPISFVSKFFNLPLVIYENNLILGRANRYLASISKKILLAKKIDINFPKKCEYKTFIVGPILSKNIINYSKENKKNNNENFSILILGGSQGAEIFGAVLPSVIKRLKDEGYKIEITQQCTKSQKASIEKFYKDNNIKNYVFEFEKNVLKLILSADLAITRSGASSTAELVHTITPFIAIPLPDSIDNHQYLNGKYYEKKGCCMFLDQTNFNKENLFKLIEECINNKKKLENIRENMQKQSKNNVYNNIEDKIKEFIKI
tara:strand:+ start:1361 stop:2446 length:1086 start_codon:yes stop_codon:yes gene_type:complete